MAENRVIGRGGGLPWHLPADLRRFKTLTLGRTIIMGRRTWDSIGRPLPGRTCIVISRNPELSAPGAVVLGSLDAALERCAAEEEVFVIGGEALYRLALPLASRLYLTLVRARVEGDVIFPLEDFAGFRLLEEEERPADAKNVHPLSFRVYERRG